MGHGIRRKPCDVFLGLYGVPSIVAAPLTEMLVDTFSRLNFSFNQLCGKCYDGTSAIKGGKSGVSKRISDIEPRAVHTHCFRHSINLAVSNTLKEIRIMRDVLDMTKEMTKLIKFSPRRGRIFQALNEACDSKSGMTSTRNSNVMSNEMDCVCKCTSKHCQQPWRFTSYVGRSFLNSKRNRDVS